ncbi:thermonuclease family protein [Leisingera sp. M658]|uniref:thermonuclease family protein n=1 Tax=Leisingera sp. M658 TaxID=2867015 RepID=UPI0021A651F9|nr:thermonuclease family protein [Leisingera sp. M658]UWQ77428.1 thermonuclease family protein [Leisingera sp. M658]
MIELATMLKLFYQMQKLAALAGLLVTIGTASATAGTLRPEQIRVIDGDTIEVDGQSYRLVGYDTPETYFAQCDFELALGTAATERLENLIAGGPLIELKKMPGLDRYNRKLGRLFVGRRNVSEILISENLARPYSGGRRAGWCE